MIDTTAAAKSLEMAEKSGDRISFNVMMIHTVLELLHAIEVHNDQETERRESVE